MLPMSLALAILMTDSFALETFKFPIPVNYRLEALFKSGGNVNFVSSDGFAFEPGVNIYILKIISTHATTDKHST